MQGPSPHGDQYTTIVYKRCATEVVHDWGSVKHLTAVRATSPEAPKQLAKVVPPKGARLLQSTLHAFFQPRVLNPEDTEDT